MEQQDTRQTRESTASSLVLKHLKRWPHDLIDIRRLMLRYQASANDVQDAFTSLDESIQGHIDGE